MSMSSPSAGIGTEERGHGVTPPPPAAPPVIDQGDDDLPPGQLALGERLRRIALAPVRLLAAILLPDRWMPREVGAGRVGAALLALLLTGFFGAAMVGARLDVSTDVLAQAAGGGGGMGSGMGGGAAAMSDREIQAEIAKTLGVERVMRALGATLGRTGIVLALALVLYLIGTYVGGKPTMRRALSATAHAALPFAVKSLIIGGAALGQQSLTPAQADGLVGNPLAPIFAGLGDAGRLLEGVDPFLLWSVVLLGFGLAAAAELRRRRAFITVITCFALFLCLSRVVCVAPPEGGGPPGRGGPMA